LDYLPAPPAADEQPADLCRSSAGEPIAPIW
jgi:hypothetical protein